jgi:hypothetical protein
MAAISLWAARGNFFGNSANVNASRRLIVPNGIQAVQTTEVNNYRYFSSNISIFLSSFTNFCTLISIIQRVAKVTRLSVFNTLTRCQVTFATPCMLKLRPIFVKQVVVITISPRYTFRHSNVILRRAENVVAKCLCCT